MKKWEYKTLHSADIDEFCSAGQDGWELAGYSSTVTKDIYNAIFKREIEETATKDQSGLEHHAAKFLMHIGNQINSQCAPEDRPHEIVISGQLAEECYGLIDSLLSLE